MVESQMQGSSELQPYGAISIWCPVWFLQATAVLYRIYRITAVAIYGTARSPTGLGLSYLFFFLVPLPLYLGAPTLLIYQTQLQHLMHGSVGV